MPDDDSSGYKLGENYPGEENDDPVESGVVSGVAKRIV